MSGFSMSGFLMSGFSMSGFSVSGFSIDTSEPAPHMADGNPSWQREVEESYQEYLRQCSQQPQNEGNNAVPELSTRQGDVSVTETFARLSTSSPPDQDDIQSPFLPAVSRGRGRGRARLSAVELSRFVSPVPGLPATPTALSSSPGDGHSNVIRVGRGRASISPRVEPIGVSSPGIDVPLPILNPIRGRGQGHRPIVVDESLNRSQLALGFERGVPDGSIGTGVESFADIEREIVVRKGEKGLMIPVTANFVRLSVAQGRGLFMYHVDFEPGLDSVRIKRFMLNGHENVLGSVRTFDGANLYLPFQLQDQQTVLQSAHPAEPELSVQIIIRFVRENQMSENVHFYNVLFRRIMEKLGMQEVNRNYYDYRARLEIWPGYVTAVDELEGGLMLCCDVSHRVLRTGTLLEVYNEMHSGCHRSPDRLRQMYSDYVISTIVLTRYNRKNYRVDDVDYTLSPKSTFTLGSGETVSYVDYYRRQYNLAVTDLDQPLIIHRPKQTKETGRRRTLELVCLLPEFCHMTGLTEDLKKDHRVMRDVAQNTRVPPHQRTLAVKEFVKKVKENAEAAEILRSWGLELEDATIELPARRIAPPNVVINQNTILTKQFDFNRDLSHNTCLEPIHVKNWIIYCTPFDKPKADLFVENYYAACRNIGIEVRSRPQIVPVNGQERRRVENFSRTIMETLTSSTQFVVIIVPSEIGELYEAIKKICCVERPVPSQVILASTLMKERQVRAIVTKVALQINCKLGGALWTIRIPLGEKIMFVGMDVYHDPRRRNPSVLALVASLNNIQTKYYSRIVAQRTHQEVGDSLRAIFVDALHMFYKQSGAWPDRVVVFRDGVGDGQLEITKDTEVVQMTQALTQVCGQAMPKFTFTVVQKRISCRFYAKDPESNNFVNAPPGTVLDHSVTRKYLYDFFLVSQLVLQGTVNPTHYIVLEDIGNVQPDLIQKFAFATSFLYYNWAAPIRVPAVCQYAHKLAFLVGQYIKETPSHELSCQLYYL